MVEQEKHCPYERDQPFEVALTLIQQEIQVLDLTYRLHLLGRQSNTVYVQLIDKKGNVVSDGTGKGEFAEGLLGALFEAVEHYCSMHLIDQENQFIVAISNLRNIDQCKNERVIDLLLKQPEKTVLARRYKSADEQEELHYPVFITDPPHWKRLSQNETFDCRTLIRYASNSGTAIGATEDEAFVHAVNEVVERDAFSRFLFDKFYLPDGIKLPLVDLSKLPESLRRIAKSASNEIGAKIYVIDITSSLNIPTYIAITDSPVGYQPPHGCGASMNPLHAIRRCLTELLQMHRSWFSFKHHSTLDADKFSELEAYPDLLRCMQLDMRACINRCGTDIACTPKNYSGIGHSAYDHRMAIISRINQTGRQIYWTTRYKAANGITAITSVIPGCDRFFLVTYGLIVLPSDPMGPTLALI